MTTDVLLLRNIEAKKAKHFYYCEYINRCDFRFGKRLSMHCSFLVKTYMEIKWRMYACLELHIYPFKYQIYKIA